ncbi:MAG TPA: prenyltransferase [Syntrophorhabdales bacterium]|nr:prenyltransferase [Syntrophorhabdales bacterium]
MEARPKRSSGKIIDAFVATRPWSFAMSLISVAIATLVAAEDGPFLWGWFILVCVGIVCFHATANVLNDYFDTLHEVDQPDSPTARYRPQPILTGMFTPRQLLIEGGLLGSVTIAVGLILAFERALAVLWIGTAGFLASVFYTAGPVKYKYRAWGEVFVFLMWGPLMFEGAYVVQRQVLSLKAFVVSVPFGVLVALVLLANNIRDIAYDSRQRIKTVGIVLGHLRAVYLYAALIMAAYAYVVAEVLARVLSPWALLVLLSLPKAIGLVREVARKVPDEADALTAQLNTLFGLLLIAGLIMARVVPL